MIKCEVGINIHLSDNGQATQSQDAPGARECGILYLKNSRKDCQKSELTWQYMIALSGHGMAKYISNSANWLGA